MRKPRYRVLGWSWLGVVNFLIIQWFFVRLEGVSDSKESTEMELGIRGWIMPLTGWWNKYWQW